MPVTCDEVAGIPRAWMSKKITFTVRYVMYNDLGGEWWNNPKKHSFGGCGKLAATASKSYLLFLVKLGKEWIIESQIILLQAID